LTARAGVCGDRGTARSSEASRSLWGAKARANTMGRTWQARAARSRTDVGEKLEPWVVSDSPWRAVKLKPVMMGEKLEPVGEQESSSRSWWARSSSPLASREAQAGHGGREAQARWRAGKLEPNRMKWARSSSPGVSRKAKNPEQRWMGEKLEPDGEQESSSREGKGGDRAGGNCKEHD